VAVAQCLDGSLDDVVGRAEIRLPDAEIDDVAALGVACSSVRRAKIRAKADFYHPAAVRRRAIHAELCRKIKQMRDFRSASVAPEARVGILTAWACGSSS
jgi:hypothetical protein